VYFHTQKNFMSSFLNNGIGGQAEWGDEEAWKNEGSG
jgi:hypothetical protein